jgi:hypothetical protein
MYYRAGWHRVQLYKVLANMDYHVIAVDYRGKYDSSISSICKLVLLLKMIASCAKKNIE